MILTIINLATDAPPQEIDLGGRSYLDLKPTADSRKRHMCALVFDNGTCHVDYDSKGSLVGIELVECDPRELPYEPAEYLQPKDPRKQ